MGCVSEPRIIAHLTAATRIYQAAAESQLVRDASSATGYRWYLACLFGFERGLVRVTHAGLDLGARIKTSAIAHDLMALDFTSAEVCSLPVCDAPPMIRSVANALGWLFVSERMAFAHCTAFQHLDLWIRKSARSYIDLLLGRSGWLELVRLLDTRIADAEDAELVISSAVTAFRARRDWFSSNAPGP